MEKPPAEDIKARMPGLEEERKQDLKEDRCPSSDVSPNEGLKIL